MRPLFSIVTVCYNSGKTIERTIKSVLAQDFRDYEYIIVDGASKDNTMDVVLRYEPLFEGRMRYTSEPDRGIYDAFNKGIKQAQGEYVWIVNSDDFMDSNALSKLKDVAEAQKGEKVIIEGVARLVQRDGQVKLSTLSTEESRLKNYRKKLLGITHPSSVFSRRVYEEVGLYDDAYYILADKDIYIRSYEQGVKFVTINQPITTMSWGGISTNLQHKKWLKDQWRASRKFGNGRIDTIMIFGGFLKLYFRLRLNAFKNKITKC